MVIASATIGQARHHARVTIADSPASWHRAGFEVQLQSEWRKSQQMIRASRRESASSMIVDSTGADPVDWTMMKTR
jgi:methylmalonyl-CoA mutase cobalamin-binding subunit